MEERFDYIASHVPARYRYDHGGVDGGVDGEVDLFSADEFSNTVACICVEHPRQNTNIVVIEH